MVVAACVCAGISVLLLLAVADAGPKVRIRHDEPIFIWVNTSALATISPACAADEFRYGT